MSIFNQMFSHPAVQAVFIDGVVVAKTGENFDRFVAMSPGQFAESFKHIEAESLAGAARINAVAAAGAEAAEKPKLVIVGG